MPDTFTTPHLIVYSNPKEDQFRAFSGFESEEQACDWAEKHLPEDTWFHEVMENFRPAMHAPVLDKESGDYCTECELHTSQHDMQHTLEALAERTRKRIEEQGHEVVCVFPTDESLADGSFTSPLWYSFGRTEKGQSEILVTGHLDPEVGAYMVNTAADKDERGELHLGEHEADTFLAEVPVRIIEADPVAAGLNRANSAYGDKVTAFQILYPDDKGRWPDDPEFGKPQGFQQPVYAKEQS